MTRMAPTRSLALVSLGSVLLLAVTAVDAQAAVQRFDGRYTASYKGLTANARMTITPARNGAWMYLTTVDHMLANMSQATVFQEVGNQYRPLGGSDRSSYASVKRGVTTSYNWAAGQARWSGDVKPNRAGPVRLQNGDMDALLINLALARDVPAGRPLSYRMVENGRARPMNYRVIGRERVTIGGRNYDATKVAQGGTEKQTIAWIVAGIPAPVRIVQRENGATTISLQMNSWSH